MTFQTFASQHGLIIKSVVLDRWVRVPTDDHPHKKNGAYIYNGYTGAVQNWAVHDKPIYYKDSSATYDPSIARKKAEKAEQDKIKRQKLAAKKAEHIISECKEEPHPYLKRKGFDNLGLVYQGDLIIPMQVNGNVVGCQRISEDGTKKFLYGQRTKGAYCGFDNKGRVILTEGYATALSVRRALKKVGTRYKIYVCFSASNILEIANQHPDCIVVADNDTVGIRTAKQSGRNYWVSDVEGEDANDFELRTDSGTLGKQITEVLNLKNHQ